MVCTPVSHDGDNAFPAESARDWPKTGHSARGHSGDRLTRQRVWWYVDFVDSEYTSTPTPGIDIPTLSLALLPTAHTPTHTLTHTPPFSPGIYGVGQAAVHPPALAVLSHRPPGAEETICWVGKGIVYDTGGLSIKTKVGLPPCAPHLPPILYCLTLRLYCLTL